MVRMGAKLSQQSMFDGAQPLAIGKLARSLSMHSSMHVVHLFKPAL